MKTLRFMKGAGLVLIQFFCVMIDCESGEYWCDKHIDVIVEQNQKDKERKLCGTKPWRN